jgi:hypothetical protein
MTQIYPILPQSQKHNTFSFFSRLWLCCKSSLFWYKSHSARKHE